MTLDFFFMTLDFAMVSLNRMLKVQAKKKKINQTSLKLKMYIKGHKKSERQHKEWQKILANRLIEFNISNI